MIRAIRSPGLLVLTLNACLTVKVDFDVEAHRVATDGAVFDVVLVGAGRDVDRNHDFFTTGVTDVGRLGMR